MSNKIILESLSMDLLRVALGYHRGSMKMAQRFSEEALKRKREIGEKEVSPYLQKTLARIEDALSANDIEEKAEDALMYSTLIRNFSRTLEQSS